MYIFKMGKTIKQKKSFLTMCFYGPCLHTWVKILVDKLHDKVSFIKGDVDSVIEISPPNCCCHHWFDC